MQSNPCGHRTLNNLLFFVCQNDTQLVSILYRTHKSLPPAAKVSSLYAFDALSRAARSQVHKHGLTGDINSEKGNSATFLLKVEGVLEGLFQDMIMIGTPESKVSFLSANQRSISLRTMSMGLLLRSQGSHQPHPSTLHAKNNLPIAISRCDYRERA